ncbi:MAG: hypothetical protein ACYTAF_17500 [Planctomycetota bacterium]|jgi:hypothetical protein
MMLEKIVAVGIGLLIFLILIGIYAALVSGAREDEMRERLFRRLHEEREKRKDESTGEEDEERAVNP